MRNLPVFTAKKVVRFVFRNDGRQAPSLIKTSKIMNRYMLLVLIVNLLIATSVAAEENQLAVSTRQNQTMYVDDELWITVRTGPDANAEKIKVIKSGVKMTILSYEEGADYAQVRTEDNVTGWVLYRYLSPEPPAVVQLDKVNQELAGLRERYDAASSALKDLKNETREQSEHIKELERVKQMQETQLAEVRSASENAIQIQQQNQTFQEQTRELKSRISELTSDNNTLRSRLMLYVAGAAVAALLIGLYIGTIPLRRDKRWRSMP